MGLDDMLLGLDDMLLGLDDMLLGLDDVLRAKMTSQEQPRSKE
jgi:hypothetical protein